MCPIASISLMWENPVFSASRLFVAGKMDAIEMKKFGNQSFWILCFESDETVKKNDDEALNNLVSLSEKVMKEW